MHELSIAQALVEELERAAAAHPPGRITSVTVSVGSLSGVDPDALLAAFPLAAEGTPAAGAALRIDPVDAQAACRACGHTAPVTELWTVCAACNSPDLEISGGRELFLTSFVLATDSGD